ncbi:MAG: hypothetical protein U0360_05805 [Dehalococcoidia bacterium]
MRSERALGLEAEGDIGRAIAQSVRTAATARAWRGRREAAARGSAPKSSRTSTLVPGACRSRAATLRTAPRKFAVAAASSAGGRVVKSTSAAHHRRQRLPRSPCVHREEVLGVVPVGAGVALEGVGELIGRSRGCRR